MVYKEGSRIIYDNRRQTVIDANYLPGVSIMTGCIAAFVVGANADLIN